MAVLRAGCSLRLAGGSRAGQHLRRNRVKDATAWSEDRASLLQLPRCQLKTCFTHQGLDSLAA